MLLNDEINGFLMRKWNLEKPLCFIESVLQAKPGIKGTPNIRRRIKQRSLEWEHEKFQMLTPSTILCAEANVRRKRGKSNAKERAKVLTSLAHRGNIRSVMRHACKRGKGCVLMPGDIDSEIGNLASETLMSNCPEGCDVSMCNVLVFEDCPCLTDVQAEGDAVEEVVKNLTGVTGPFGVNVSSLIQ